MIVPSTLLQRKSILIGVDRMKKIHTQIETELIASDDGKHTYEVIKRLSGVEGESGYLISLYPTRNETNIFSNDSTLNHIVSHMSELGFNELHLINLFSMVVSTKISSKGLKGDEENMKYIENLMKESDFKKCKFIVAWGNSMVSSKAVQLSKLNIFNLYKKHCPKNKIYQLTTVGKVLESDVAPHPLYLGIRANNAVWGLKEFKLSDNTTVKEIVKSKKKS